MAVVKVRNLNTISFDVKWRGDEIKIPAGGFVEMDWEDANTFIRTPFKSMVKDGMGQDLPEGMQKLKIEREGDITKYAAKLTPHCPVCKEELAHWDALDGHTAAMHSNQILDDEEYKKFLKAKEGKASASNAKPTSGGLSA
jgi:hypothetical protein